MLQRVWSDDSAGELTLWFFSKYNGKDLQPPCFQLWMKDDDGLLNKLMAKASLLFCVYVYIVYDITQSHRSFANDSFQSSNRIVKHL